MILRLLFIALFILSPSAIFAQGDTPVEGGEVVPEGRNGRYSEEQSEIIALRAVPGEVLDRDAEWRDGRFYYWFTIKVADGSIYDVEVNTILGEVRDIRIEYFVPGAHLPMSIIDKRTAEAIALSDVQNNTHGRTKAEVEGVAALSAFQRKPVYEVRVKKLVRSYAVIVEATSGEVLSIEEVE